MHREGKEHLNVFVRHFRVVLDSKAHFPENQLVEMCITSMGTTDFIWKTSESQTSRIFIMLPKKLPRPFILYYQPIVHLHPSNSPYSNQESTKPFPFYNNKMDLHLYKILYYENPIRKIVCYKIHQASMRYVGFAVCNKKDIRVNQTKGGPYFLQNIRNKPTAIKDSNMI